MVETGGIKFTETDSPLNEDFPENSFQHIFWEEQRKFSALKNKASNEMAPSDHPICSNSEVYFHKCILPSVWLLVTSIRENSSGLHPLVFSE